MAILPLGHNYNLASPGILGAFYTGGTVVLAPSTDTAEIFRLVEQRARDRDRGRGAADQRLAGLG